MNEKRITLIALFDKFSLDKMDDVLKNVNEKMCKVPFREDDREIKDTLPYHFTFAVWNEDRKEDAISVIRNFKFNKINLKIIGVDIKESYNNSYNLYFNFKPSKELFNLQNKIYNLSKIEKYNPNSYIPHITIHCDKDYNKLLKMKDSILQDFKDFEVSFNKLGLFRIYPAEEIETLEENKN